MVIFGICVWEFVCLFVGVFSLCGLFCLCFFLFFYYCYFVWPFFSVKLLVETVDETFVLPRVHQNNFTQFCNRLHCLLKK